MSRKRSGCVKGHVVIVGLGNIGSFTAGLVARLPGVSRVTLIDRDVYEAGNVAGQDIAGRDAVGRPKTSVQAARIRRINPRLPVLAIRDHLENIPLGLLRADCILGCLDSKRARQVLSEMAWRMSAGAYVDAGVQADGLLARVSVWIPGPDGACLECGWSDREYAALEQAYPCVPDMSIPSPTGAPACLGALAASLQVLECRKVLSGEYEPGAGGREIILEAAGHRAYVLAHERNRECRFDHVRLGSPKTVRLACIIGDVVSPARGGGALRMADGRSFLTRLVCRKCGRGRRLLRLQGRLRPGDRRCSRCGGALVPLGFEVREYLDMKVLPRRDPRRTLRAVGMMPGDVFTVRGAGGETVCEVEGGGRDLEDCCSVSGCARPSCARRRL